MTWKVLARVKNSSAAAAAGGTVELITLYTVPAGKSALLKEILIQVTKILAGNAFHVYILKSGGTDFPTPIAAGTLFSTLDQGIANPGGDVFGETADAGPAAVGLTVLARNTFLASGDAVKLIDWHSLADAADVMRAKVTLSGTEF